MKTATLNLITEIVTARYGFITDADIDQLTSEATLLHCKVLIRCDEGRKVVPLHAVQSEIRFLEMAGNHIRDVAFTADECARLREHG